MENFRISLLPDKDDKGKQGIYYHVTFHDLQASNHLTMLPSPPTLIKEEIDAVFEHSGMHGDSLFMVQEIHYARIGKTYIFKAFHHGLHVLIEKPAGVYTKQVRQMNEAAKESGKVFSIMYNQRTNPLYQKLRDLIHSGELGEIRRMNWIITNWYRSQSYYDSGGWRATWAEEGGGVLLNQDPHQFDLWQWTTGMMHVRIRAFCSFGKYRNIEVEDDVTAYVEYENGATGLFVTSISSMRFLREHRCWRPGKKEYTV